MLHDIYTRPLKDLRISVTDRCNFRCTYCMPFDEYEWIAKKELLTFEEIARLADLFVQLGVDKIRLTGGEPLLRRDLEKLISKLSSLNGLEDLCLTNNGSLLALLISEGVGGPFYRQALRSSSYQDQCGGRAGCKRR